MLFFEVVVRRSNQLVFGSDVGMTEERKYTDQRSAST